MKNLRGRVAIVTGAGSGIGQGAAVALANRGANILVGDVVEAGACNTARIITEGGGNSVAVLCDVSDDGSLDNLRDLALRHFGRLDIDMNNVGVLVSGDPQDIPISEWSRAMNVNFLSAVRAIHAIVPHFLTQGEGHIVNPASFAGLFPYAYDRLPYAASKAALVTLSEGLALYLKPKGVGVTLLCSGRDQHRSGPH